MPDLRKGALKYVRDEDVRILQAETPPTDRRPSRVVAWVRGDNDRYTVQLADGAWSCTCGSRRRGAARHWLPVGRLQTGQDPEGCLMAYNARYTGEIQITPPLTWSEIKQGPGLEDLRLHTVEHVEDTDEGRITRITADGIVPLTTNEYPGCDALKELQALVDQHGKDHQFAGHIEAVGEEGDRWRLVVRNSQAVQIEPRLIWPDEDGEASE